MKSVLVTGENSYIGNSFEQWVKLNHPEIKVSKVSLKDDNWKNQSWKSFDSILHVAGIAHNSSRKDMENLYYSVNRDLTIKVAEKAENDGVKQFVNLSSMIVYGSNVSKITNETKPNPDNFYGDSKLQADHYLEKLDSSTFKVAIIRPPMVYGPKSKGNYPLLAKLAKVTPIFPKYKNIRSMIFINNLTELISLIIKNQSNGFFFPQNKEYVVTSNLVKVISKDTYLTKLFNPLIKLTINFRITKKIFGNLYYDKNMSKHFNASYQLFDLEKSVKLTER